MTRIASDAGIGHDQKFWARDYDKHTMFRLMIGYETETTALSMLVPHNSSTNKFVNLSLGSMNEEIYLTI